MGMVTAACNRENVAIKCISHPAFGGAFETFDNAPLADPRHPDHLTEALARVATTR
jgi:hypothetical protein